MRQCSRVGEEACEQQHHGRLCVRRLIQARVCPPPLLSYKVVPALPVVAIVEYGNDREGKDYLVTQQGGPKPGLDEAADAEPALEAAASERATAAQCRS